MVLQLIISGETSTQISCELVIKTSSIRWSAAGKSVMFLKYRNVAKIWPAFWNPKIDCEQSNFSPHRLLPWFVWRGTGYYSLLHYFLPGQCAIGDRFQSLLSQHARLHLATRSMKPSNFFVVLRIGRSPVRRWCGKPGLQAARDCIISVWRCRRWGAQRL